MALQETVFDPENVEARRLLEQMYTTEDEATEETQGGPFWYTESEQNPMGMGSRLRGRSAFAGVPETVDESELLRQAFGLSKEDAAYAMNPQYGWINTWGQMQRDKGESDQLMRSAMKEAGAGIGGFTFKDWDDYQKVSDLIKGSAREARQAGSSPWPTSFGFLKNKGVIQARGLSDEQALFRAWSKLTPEQREKFNLKSEREAIALTRVGKKGEDWWNSTLKGDVKDVKRAIKEYQPSKSGGNLLSRIAEVVMPAGLALLTGGALGLALGPATTIAGTAIGSGTLGSTGAGIAGGALGGATTGLINQAKAGTMNLGQMALSTGMGAAAGGVAGGLRSVFGSATNPVVEAAQRGTGMGLRGVTGAAEQGSWLGGLASTGNILDVGKKAYGAYNELQAGQAAIDAQRAAFSQAAEPTAQAMAAIPGVLEEQEQMWQGIRSHQSELLAARRQAMEEEGYDPLESTQAGLV